MDAAAITSLAQEPQSALARLLVVRSWQCCLVWCGTARSTDVLELDLIELHIPSWDDVQLGVTSEFKLGWLDPAWSWTQPSISFTGCSLGKLCYPLRKNSSLPRGWLAHIQGTIFIMLWATVCCQNSTGLLCPSSGTARACVCVPSPGALSVQQTLLGHSTAAVVLGQRVCRLDVCPSLDGDHQLICSGAMSCERPTATRVSTRQCLPLERSSLFFPPLPPSATSAFLV